MLQVFSLQYDCKQLANERISGDALYCTCTRGGSFFTYILNKTTFGLLLHNSEKGPATGLDPIRFKTPCNTTQHTTRW